ncbi:hypothetical protein BKA70DRAFT_1229216 [Coprinopsis sp. MPI-PUGE-AT-0042]|nr:hypothetical protein BKA70DRAFT_1229216 [Coprinopsis sp. MPI-PUGE-AT-0042]
MAGFWGLLFLCSKPWQVVAHGIPFELIRGIAIYVRYKIIYNILLDSPRTLANIPTHIVDASKAPPYPNEHDGAYRLEGVVFSQLSLQAYIVKAPRLGQNRDINRTWSLWSLATVRGTPQVEIGVADVILGSSAVPPLAFPQQTIDRDQFNVLTHYGDLECLNDPPSSTTSSQTDMQPQEGLNARADAELDKHEPTR